MRSRPSALLAALFAPLALGLAACSSGDEPADAGPAFELPQILPERGLLCLNYEVTTVNQPRTFPLAVTNQGAQQLVISGSNIEGDERGHFSLLGPDVDIVETYGTALFQLTYSPTEAGWDDAFIEVTSNAQNFPLLRVAVLARAVPEGPLDGGVDNWDAGPKPMADNGDAGETCPDESRM